MLLSEQMELDAFHNGWDSETVELVRELETANAELLESLRYAIKILKPLVNDDLEPVNIGAIQVMQRAIANASPPETS